MAEAIWAALPSALGGRARRRERAHEPSREADARPKATSIPARRIRASRDAPVGHAGAEAELLAAYREGRLAHAWLIGGPEGIGKATLAWRFARFVLAHPDPAAPAVRDGARSLRRRQTIPPARQLAALAHPDFALLRRDLERRKRRASATEIRVDDVRAGACRCSTFRRRSAAGASRSSTAPTT